MADAAYQAKYLTVARLLWDSSNGVPGDIPESYCEHLSHEYFDGDISFAPLLSRLEYTEGLESWEVEEAIEILGKVNPDDWPDLEDIESVSVEDLLEDDAEVQEEKFEYVEDNLGTSEKVERVLIETISAVFGDRVSEVRSEKGYFPNQKNGFLQEDDGTFAGMFTHDGKKYLFEVFPDEQGWTVTYRMHWKDIGDLPALSHEDDEKTNNYSHQVRNRGWK
jgi:hypothetical protein